MVKSALTLQVNHEIIQENGDREAKDEAKDKGGSLARFSLLIKPR